jgi:hypothetical protein
MNKYLSYNHPVCNDSMRDAAAISKLKEIADKLDEDSNPVIMLIKHKK